MAHQVTPAPAFIETPRPKDEDAWLARLRLSIKRTRSGHRTSDDQARLLSFGPFAKDVLKQWFQQLDSSNAPRSDHLRNLARERLLLLPDVLQEAEELGLPAALARIAEEANPSLLRKRVEVVRSIQVDYPGPVSVDLLFRRLCEFGKTCEDKSASIEMMGSAAPPFDPIDPLAWPFSHLAVLPEAPEDFLVHISGSVQNPCVRRRIEAVGLSRLQLSEKVSRQLLELRPHVIRVRGLVLEELQKLTRDGSPPLPRRDLASQVTTALKRSIRGMSYETYELLRRLESQHGLRGGLQSIVRLIATVVARLCSSKEYRELPLNWKADSFLSLPVSPARTELIGNLLETLTDSWEREQWLSVLLDHHSRIALRKTVQIKIPVVPSRENLICSRVYALAELMTTSVENPGLKRTLIEYLDDSELAPQMFPARKFHVRAGKTTARVSYGDRKAISLSPEMLGHLLMLVKGVLTDRMPVSGFPAGDGHPLSNPAQSIGTLRRKLIALDDSLSTKVIQVHAGQAYELKIEGDRFDFDFVTLRRLRLSDWAKKALDSVERLCQVG